jgi:hypothetical protein
VYFSGVSAPEIFRKRQFFIDFWSSTLPALGTLLNFLLNFLLLFFFKKSIEEISYEKLSFCFHNFSQIFSKIIINALIFLFEFSREFSCSSIFFSHTGSDVCSLEHNSVSFVFSGVFLHFFLCPKNYWGVLPENLALFVCFSTA